MILKSNSKSDPFIYFTFIKRKDEQNWEKPSTGEGKSIKLSLDEIAMIQRLLKKTAKSWKGFHTYEGTKTSIELIWTGEDEIQIKVDQYSKQIKAGQIDVLRLLFKHLLKEKVEFSTELKSLNEFKGSNNAEKEINAPETRSIPPKKSPSPKKIPDTANQPEISGISGIIEKSTEKALQIKLESGELKWVPKSKIHSEFDPVSQELQLFQVESWILKKKDNNTRE